MKLTVTSVLALLFLISCNSKIDPETYARFRQNGNEISDRVQSTLLSNVGRAIQTGGPEYAVEFCNLRAASIIDSLNEVNNCKILRVSENNRNPGAALGSDQEKELWEIFSRGALSDTIIQENSNLIFYKPIRIGMPACLKCHGSIETDINQATQKKLQELYPNDLATGYTMNDFRGLWKIEFENR